MDLNQTDAYGLNNRNKLKQRFSFQEPDDRIEVQLISLKGPNVSLLFPLRTASLRGPICPLQGRVYKNVKRMCVKCLTQTAGTCGLKTEHRVEEILPHTEYYHTQNITTHRILPQNITTHRILPHTEYYHTQNITTEY